MLALNSPITLFVSEKIPVSLGLLLIWKYEKWLVASWNDKTQDITEGGQWSMERSSSSVVADSVEKWRWRQACQRWVEGIARQAKRKYFS